MSIMSLPPNMLMLVGDYSGDKKVDHVVVQWCHDTLRNGFEFGWHQRRAWTMTVTGPDNDTTYEVAVSCNIFCIKFDLEADMIAFRLRWTDMVSPQA